MSLEGNRESSLDKIDQKVKKWVIIRLNFVIFVSKSDMESEK